MTIIAGRLGAQRALDGQTVSPPPVALFTWGFDYIWQVADLPPWQLACGTRDDWHRAHLALLERHRPDLLFYSGSDGTGLSLWPERAVHFEHGQPAAQLHCPGGGRCNDRSRAKY